MASLNLATGMWEDDQNGPAGYQPGSLGMQQDTPHALASMPPAPLPADNTPVNPQPMSPAALAAMNAPPPAQPPPVPPPPAAQLGSPAPAPPAGPVVEPYVPPAMPAIPAGRVVTPAESATLGQIDQNVAAKDVSAQQVGQVGVQKATATEAAASRDEQERLRHQQEQQRIIDDAAKRTQALEAAAKTQWDQYRQMGVKDPEASQSFGHRLLAAIAIGLGEYSSKMNGGPNRAADLIAAANAQNIALQKAAIEKKYKEAEMAGGDVTAAKTEMQNELRNLDLKHSALLDASAAKLKTELSRMGVPEAQIAANQEIQKVQAAGLDEKEKALTSIRNSELELTKAQLASADKAKALAAHKVKAAGTGGGGGSTEAMAKLSEYALANPGDSAGLYRLAGDMGLSGKTANKAVEAAITHNKSTESQSKDAQQAAVGLRAVEAIEKSGYTPSKAEIQKWMNNQKEVARAAKMGEGTGVGGFIGGGVSGLMQGHGLMAQSETDGLSDKAKDYFTNARRYMETIGRKQSGAAISNTEWTNFFNQYGPNSAGGIPAAKQYLIDQAKSSGVSGRQLGLDAAASSSPAAPASDRAARAKAIVNDQSKRSLYTTEQWAALIKASRAQ